MGEAGVAGGQDFELWCVVEDKDVRRYEAETVVASPAPETDDEIPVPTNLKDTEHPLPQHTRGRPSSRPAIPSRDG